MLSDIYAEVCAMFVRVELSTIFFQVCRGTAVMLVSPTQGAEEISNPFEAEDGDTAAA